jgi:hypothetical protein
MSHMSPYLLAFMIGAVTERMPLYTVIAQEHALSGEIASSILA